MSRFKSILFFLLISICGCVSQKKLVYFQGSIPVLNKDSIYKVRIYPGDILSVNVFTINTEAYPYFALPGDRTGTDTRSAYEKGYVVNDKGEIKLPLIGSVSLNGLTISEATSRVETKFNEFISDPIITIKKLNFKVTVLGEVNKPGTYPIMNEKATLPEVLGMAGDLSQFANRKTLRIIREENGTRKDFFVDLTLANSLSPESFYLHPDDIVYVEPVPRRAFQNMSPSFTIFTSLITSTAVLLTLIITTNK